MHGFEKGTVLKTYFKTMEELILVPIAGAVVVGLMARYGSAAIRGHGFPEAMEQVLLNKSRIPARITLLKPVSAAISIGTGGPFGAEGPIIATGGAVGSLVGQLLHTTALERKTLLAAGAAAGMTATFGSPVSAVLLAVELLLFELTRSRTRSITCRSTGCGGPPSAPSPLACAATSLRTRSVSGTTTSIASFPVTSPDRRSCFSGRSSSCPGRSRSGAERRAVPSLHCSPSAAR